MAPYMVYGAPVGARQFLDAALDDKIAEVDAVVADVSRIPDARLVFHLHRATASVCRVTHLARLIPTTLLSSIATRLDDRQLRAFCDLSDVPVTSAVSTQVALPLRHGGLGLTPLATIATVAHVASIIDTADARLDLLRTRNPSATPEALVAEVTLLLAPVLPHLHSLPKVPTVTATAVREHPTPT